VVLSLELSMQAGRAEIAVHHAYRPTHVGGQDFADMGAHPTATVASFGTGEDNPPGRLGAWIQE